MQLNGRLGEALVELREDFDVLLEMIAENKTTGKVCIIYLCMYAWMHMGLSMVSS
jgi:hypothetical protein